MSFSYVLNRLLTLPRSIWFISGIYRFVKLFVYQFGLLIMLELGIYIEVE